MTIGIILSSIVAVYLLFVQHKRMVSQRKAIAKRRILRLRMDGVIQCNNKEQRELSTAIVAITRMRNVIISDRISIEIMRLTNNFVEAIIRLKRLLSTKLKLAQYKHRNTKNNSAVQRTIKLSDVRGDNRHDKF